MNGHGAVTSVCGVVAALACVYGCLFFPLPLGLTHMHALISSFSDAVPPSLAVCHAASVRKIRRCLLLDVCPLGFLSVSFRALTLTMHLNGYQHERRGAGFLCAVQVGGLPL